MQYDCEGGVGLSPALSSGSQLIANNFDLSSLAKDGISTAFNSESQHFANPNPTIFLKTNPTIFLKTNPTIGLRIQVHYWIVASGL